MKKQNARFITLMALGYIIGSHSIWAMEIPEPEIKHAGWGDSVPKPTLLDKNYFTKMGLEYIFHFQPEPEVEHPTLAHSVQIMENQDGMKGEEYSQSCSKELIPTLQIIPEKRWCECSQHWWFPSHGHRHHVNGSAGGGWAWERVIPSRVVNPKPDKPLPETSTTTTTK